MSRVALYGGSFDPFHICHQLVIAYTLGMTDVDQVIVAPCHTHAFDKKLAPFLSRLDMVEYGISMWPRHCVTASRIEEVIAKEYGVNYTYYTVDKLLNDKSLQISTIVLILGSDIARDLPKWKYYDKLHELEQQGKLEFFFINRNGYTIDSGSKVQLPSVSSTDIRARIKAGEPINELVPLDVNNYIKKHNLYLDY